MVVSAISEDVSGFWDHRPEPLGKHQGPSLSND